MHPLGFSALIIGLVALLIFGFLNVVKQLLSRQFVDAPSWSNMEDTQTIADELSPSESAWKNAGALQEGGCTQAAAVPETWPGEIIMSSSLDASKSQRPDEQFWTSAEEVADHEPHQASGNPLRRVPISPPVEVNLILRRLLLGSAIVGVGGVAVGAMHDGELGGPPRIFRGAVPWQEGTADAPPGASGSGYVFFTAEEVAFIEAAIGRLIPNDSVGPGAVEANVPFFLYRQLAGKFGKGDHYYLGGPWPKGTPEQDYQTRFNPAQLYRAAIATIDKYVGANFNGVSFRKLTTGDQDKVLKGLESGAIKLDDSVDGKTFFAMLLQNTKEGYFSDPIERPNRTTERVPRYEDARGGLPSIPRSKGCPSIRSGHARLRANL